MSEEREEKKDLIIITMQIKVPFFFYLILSQQVTKQMEWKSVFLRKSRRKKLASQLFFLFPLFALKAEIDDDGQRCEDGKKCLLLNTNTVITKIRARQKPALCTLIR